MKKALYVFTVFIVLITSCKKENKVIETETEAESVTEILQTRTIQPSSYLPAFPGSHWKYVNSMNDTIVYTTSPGYVKDVYEDWDFEGTTGKKTIFKTDSAYVPLYNNLPLWDGYGHTGPIHNYGNLVATSLIAIIPDHLPEGSKWITYATGHNSTTSQIHKKDTAIQISGVSYYPTIIIYGEESFEFGSRISLRFKEYYTKDIGLVKKETFNDGGILNDELHLISYFINK